MLARLTRPNCARARPQELGHWFCSQNSRMSLGIAFGSDCQIIGRGSNLDSNVNSAAWPMGCRGFICSETPEHSSINCVQFEFFLERQNWGQLWVDTNPHPPDCSNPAPLGLVRQWLRLANANTGRWHENTINLLSVTYHGPKFTTHQNLFDSWTKSVAQDSEWQQFFQKRAGSSLSTYSSLGNWNLDGFSRNLL